MRSSRSRFCLRRMPTAEQKKEALKKANEALAEAKNTTSYQQFGLLAEKISEDDFRVNMGDHHAVDKTKLPPQVIQALQTMKAGAGQRADSNRAGLHDYPTGCSRSRRREAFRGSEGRPAHPTTKREIRKIARCAGQAAACAGQDRGSVKPPCATGRCPDGN